MYGWQNEAGEPIMSGEAYRFEQALDAENPPYDPDDYLSYDDDGDYADPDTCDHGDVNFYADHAWCILCDSETRNIERYTEDGQEWTRVISW